MGVENSLNGISLQTLRYIDLVDFKSIALFKTSKAQDYRAKIIAISPSSTDDKQKLRVVVEALQKDQERTNSIELQTLWRIARDLLSSYFGETVDDAAKTEVGSAPDTIATWKKDFTTIPTDIQNLVLSYRELERLRNTDPQNFLIEYPKKKPEVQSFLRRALAYTVLHRGLGKTAGELYKSANEANFLEDVVYPINAWSGKLDNIWVELLQDQIPDIVKISALTRWSAQLAVHNVPNELDLNLFFTNDKSKLLTYESELDALISGIKSNPLWAHFKDDDVFGKLLPNLLERVSKIKESIKKVKIGFAIIESPEVVVVGLGQEDLDDQQAKIKLQKIKVALLKIDEFLEAENRQTDPSYAFVRGYRRQLFNVMEAVVALSQPKELDVTKQSTIDSLRYFMDQRGIETRGEAESVQDFTSRVIDSLYDVVSASIHDWVKDTKQVRTKSWVENPFYGAATKFDIIDVQVISSSSLYKINNLEGFMDNLRAMGKNKTESEYIARELDKRKGLFEQLGIIHNRAAVMRSNLDRTSPDGALKALAALKDASLSLDLKQVFPSTPEVLATLTEKEKKISLGIEFVSRIFTVMELKKYERNSLTPGFGSLSESADRLGLNPTGFPVLSDYLDEKWHVLPFYRSDRGKLDRLKAKILGDLASLGVVDSLDQLLCLHEGLALSVGTQLDMFLDYALDDKGNTKVNASQDLGVKIAQVGPYLESTDLDREKGNPNKGIASNIVHGFVPYMRRACYCYEDTQLDGSVVTKRDSLAKIIALGKLRSVDWTTGSKDVDTAVLDQYSQFNSFIYKRIMCNPDSVPITFSTQRSDSMNEGDEIRQAMIMFGIDPGDSISRKRTKILSRLASMRGVGLLIDTASKYEIIVDGIEAFPMRKGHRIEDETIQALTEEDIKPLLVQFRKYWLSPLDLDAARYPMDRVRAYQYLFADRYSDDAAIRHKVMGKEGSNDLLLKVLFTPELTADYVVPEDGAGLKIQRDASEAVTNDIKAYMKYRFILDMLIYPYTPAIESSEEVKKLLEGSILEQSRKMEAVLNDLATIDEYALINHMGEPALSPKEIDALLNVFSVIVRRMSDLAGEDGDGAKTLKDNASTTPFRFSPGFDASDPNVPFLKWKMLRVLQEKYVMGDGLHYEKRKATRGTSYYLLRPDGKQTSREGWRNIVGKLVTSETQSPNPSLSLIISAVRTKGVLRSKRNF